MAIVTPNYIAEQIIKQNLICWEIHDRTGLLTSQDDENMSAQDSAALLLDEIEAIGNGNLKVKASGVVKSKRKGAEAHKVRTFTINLDQDRRTGGAVAVSGHGPGVEKLHHDLLNLERAKLRLEFQLEAANDKIDALNARIKELEEAEPEEDSIAGFKISDLVGLWQSYQAAQTAGGAAPGPGLAGIPEEHPEAAAFYAAEPEAARVLRCILNCKRKNPIVYAAIKNQLVKQYAL